MALNGGIRACERCGPLGLQWTTLKIGVNVNKQDVALTYSTDQQFPKVDGRAMRELFDS